MMWARRLAWVALPVSALLLSCSSSERQPGSQAMGGQASGAGATEGRGASPNGGSAQGSGGGTQPKSGALLFSTGFEDSTVATLDETERRIKDLHGLDESTGFDWEDDLESEDRDFFMNYVDGMNGHNPELLGSSLVADPDDPDNKVLETWQFGAEWQDKGDGVGWWARVQAEYDNYGHSELYYKIRFRLGQSLTVLEGSDWPIWCMLGLEMRPAIDKDGHSLSVRLRKGQSDPQLYWGVHMRSPSVQPRHLETTDVVSPKIGQWQTMEFYAKAGDDEQGRVWLAIDGQTIVNETATTMEGGTNWGRIQPLKVYGSIVDVVTSPAQGDQKALRVWFDDMQLWTKPPEGIPPEL